MSVSEKIRARIAHLIDDGKKAATNAENTLAASSPSETSMFGACEGWITSALNVVEIVCSSRHSSYRIRATELSKSNIDHQHLNYRQVHSLVGLLERLLEDIDAGMVTSIENEVTATNYDNFLDHSEAYYKNGNKNESAVIVGVIFEDTIRTISRTNDIEEDGIKLDTVISKLDKAEIITGLKAKRARAAAGLRTSATHARWDEFELVDVKPVIDLTRELLSLHLSD